jgi:bifunctional DNA-binding transcriptional regulator/antitoxin component of YhaV-PrlF toxin-antitoxin module
MHASVIDKKRLMTIPEPVCKAIGLKPHDRVEWRVEAGEIRGRRLVAQKPKETFPPGSLLKYFTPPAGRGRARDLVRLCQRAGMKTQFEVWDCDFQRRDCIRLS